MLRNWKKAVAEAEERYKLISEELSHEHYQIYKEGLEKALGTVRQELEKLKNMTLFERIRF